METTRAGGGAVRAKLSTAATGAVKSAVLRAKTASGVASSLDSRKRKRGALQDISNSHSSARTGSGVVGKKAGGVAAVVKPAVKRSVASASIITSNASANVTVRGRASKPSALTGAGGATKRRRQEVQTSLLSFQSLTSKAVKSSKTESEDTETETDAALEAIKEEPATTQSDSQATQDMAQEPEMIECDETLEKVQEQVESVPVAAPVQTRHTSAKPQPTADVPLYQPRPYVFKFNHRDSGFDETAYAAQVRDIDAEFQNSAVHCVKIVRDMDRFHKQHESKYHTEPTYIGEVQLDINEKMRAILVDWLVEVGEEYELDSQTFHKTVNLVDRCLAKFKINRKQFQLLGCACMMIAAKFEEVYGPNVDEFVYISDQTYTSEEMLEMEGKVLQALEYRIASTTCHGFLPRFCRAGCTSEKQKALVHYLCDFAILHYSMLNYRPSQLAAAAVYLSRLMTNEEQPWTPTLHHYTGFNAWDLEACVLELYRLHRVENEVVLTQRDKAKAVSEKYVAEKFHGVSAIPSMDEAALERSFLAYELPSYSTKKPVETLDTSSSGDTE